jgi:two-component system nitrogen regulation sensor histidine kinase NtrY
MDYEPRPTRLPLGRSRWRLSFERRLKMWLFAFAIASTLPTAAVAALLDPHWFPVAIVVATLATLWILTATVFFEQIVRPLQTLVNIASSLREGDFTFRARGARRGDAMGDLALEINELAAGLQRQRNAARDALSLVETVMLNMVSPVFVFDIDNCLRLLNTASERSFSLRKTTATGVQARELGLSWLLDASEEDLLSGEASASRLQGHARWSVSRTSFRLHGVPHCLLMLTDVSEVLREKERAAWQRLIQVLGHEINNSLTPIKSIAGSLRASVVEEGFTAFGDLKRGLSIIEDRSASLNRFLQAYQHLSRLPPPTLADLDLVDLIQQITALETRLVIEVRGATNLQITGDADLLQQMFINLFGNAIEASFIIDSPGHVPRVEVSVAVVLTNAVVTISDNGPGIANTANLFVPFYTTKPTGSGIGLVLAQQIAADHRGSLSLKNRQSSLGCDAKVVLPTNK